MRLRLGRPARALVVAPHPDDETVGAWGLIAALRQRGTRVRVLVVSDGAASHRASARWPARRLVAERRRETRRAMRRLGLSARDIRFLGLPDSALAGMPPRRLLPSACVRGVGLLIGPAAVDAHPDHRAVARAIRLCPTPARRLAFQVWPATKRGGGRALRHGGVAAKRSAIRSYRTQTGSIRDDPAGFAMSAREIDLFARAIERFEEGHR